MWAVHGLWFFSCVDSLCLIGSCVGSSCVTSSCVGSSHVTSLCVIGSCLGSFVISSCVDSSCVISTYVGSACVIRLVHAVGYILKLFCVVLLVDYCEVMLLCMSFL